MAEDVNGIFTKSNYDKLLELLTNSFATENLYVKNLQLNGKDFFILGEGENTNTIDFSNFNIKGLDVSEIGKEGNTYIERISENKGKISAVTGKITNDVKKGDSSLITSNGVATAIETVNSQITSLTDTVNANKKGLDEQITSLTDTVNANKKGLDEQISALTISVNKNKEETDKKVTNITGGSDKTIKELDELITALENKIAILESYHPQQEEPTQGE